ncbi:hypothetical protein MC7420_5248 [Coleofasciculus chthonoplastes PCC 7420]|uniref:Uncharacterized protein n=1 Tax=Coleofasciculus chthonoplastes PCC 7420 TaxID=118168 RepID=B4W2P9_9CYAN|nr:hypothetical protein MC7420_5248 [Coleofasciculus chthonoplastes PCC 7420]
MSRIAKSWEHPVLDKALPKVTQLQGFQPHLKSQRAKLGCSRNPCSALSEAMPKALHLARYPFPI